MRTIIAGSRTVTAKDVRDALAACDWIALITSVVSGTAAGADQEGERWATERGLPITRFPADWEKFGKRAGPLRNRQMAENADGLIAVWDGASRGTANMIELARERSLRIHLYQLGVGPVVLATQGEDATQRLLPHPQSDGGARPPNAPRISQAPRPTPHAKSLGNRPHQGTKYRLNAVLASVPAGAVLAAGRQPYSDEDALRELRDQLRPTHLVKRSRGNVVECVPYGRDGTCIGEHIDLRLGGRPDIAQSLIREWLARSLEKYQPHRGKGGAILYVSQRPEANLLTECLPPGLTLPSGIGRRIAANFDVRRIRGASGEARFVIVIDVRTRITIDCSMAELIRLGLDPHGLYVQRTLTTPRGPARRLAGRVRAIEADTLHLDDYEEVEGIAAGDAWLEPRKENFERVIRAAAGAHADRVIAALHARVAERVGGRARLTLVDEWVAAFRRFPPDVGQGVQLRLDASVLHADGKRFPVHEVLDRPQLVFDVGRTKTERWNQGGLDRHGPYNFERFAPRRLQIAVVCQASRQGAVEQFLQQLLDGIPGSKYAEKGFVRRYQLERPLIRTFTCASPAAGDYRQAVAAAIDDATTRNERWNLALIQIDEAFHALRGDANPYLVTKALFLTHQVPTQAFEWESIRPGVSIDATANNIGLASYAKVNGIPWLLPVHQTVAHELVVGLGSYEASSSRLGGRERYIGVTTVFSADGRYMLESRTPATPADDYLPALLAALERVIGEVRRLEGWSDDQPVRLIFHVFKDFNRREIEAVKQLMANLRLAHADFAFLHLVDDHPFMVFDPDQEGEQAGASRRKGVGAAPRGLRVDLGDTEALLCIKGPRELRQATDGLPRPLLLRLHRDSTFRDLAYLARQVFDFTCLSWRTMTPSPRPISVLYSDEVARNLLLLKDVTGWTPETILGPVGRGRWFL